jgi:hypothetical protein
VIASASFKTLEKWIVSAIENGSQVEPFSTLQDISARPKIIKAESILNKSPEPGWIDRSTFSEVRSLCRHQNLVPNRNQV